MYEQELKVGIGDMKMTMGSGVIATYALGSCVGITFYDPAIKLGALLHILLPERKGVSDPNLYKFADSGIAETLRRLENFGMDRSRTIVKIAGGANMFAASADIVISDIGQRNLTAVRSILAKNGFCISGEETGKNYARTMRLDVSTGQVTVHTFGKPDVTL